MSKNILRLFLLFGLTLFAQETPTDTNATTEQPTAVAQTDVNITAAQIATIQNQDANATAEQNSLAQSDLNATTDQNLTIDQTQNTDLNQTTPIATTDENNATKKEQENTLTQFERSFPNHIAYDNYQKAIKNLYKGDYKTAYDYAMKARDIYDINKTEQQVIPLPFIPNFAKESPYSPKRVYYKVIEYKPYELNRVIKKIKLLSPPIPSVILKKRSTMIELDVTNFGDLPLDNFEIFINGKKVESFYKIEPNQTKNVFLDDIDEIYEITFKEQYGFAPGNITINEAE